MLLWLLLLQSTDPISLALPVLLNPPLCINGHVILYSLSALHHSLPHPQLVDQRTSGKDGKITTTIATTTAASGRARSASVLSNKPLGAKSVSATATNATTHSRSTSAASRHSATISTKSSQSSLHNLAEPAGVHPHRRSRTQSDNASVHSNATAVSSSSAVAPGAPRIGTGNWGAAPAATASQDTFEELLDTVVEGDSYEGKGLGIEADSRSASNSNGTTDEAGSSQSQDELMESVSEQHHIDHNAAEGDFSNDTFELDLDQAFNEQGSSGSAQVGQASMQIDGKSVLIDDAAEVAPAAQAPRTQTRKRGHSTSGSRSAKKSEIDPDDWLALRATVQREAERKVLEVQKEYREELDVWDISMVAEYSDEIFEYMEELEVSRQE